MTAPEQDTPDAPKIPAVIVSVPHDLGPVDILVRHHPWGEIQVDVRSSNSRQSWTPIQLMGGGYVVRP